MYLIAKHIHVTAVATSVVLFILRFLLLAFNPSVANSTLLRIIPHIAYTMLVLSAAWLCSQLNIYPFVNPWVTTKLLGLISFVLLALWATQWAKTNSIKWTAFLCSILSLATTVHVALSKQALFF